MTLAKSKTWSGPSLEPALMYQVHCGRWSPDSSPHEQPTIQTFRRLADEDWSRLVSLGFTVVYLMGIFDSRGPVLVSEEEGVNLRDRIDRIPSMMALQDHRAVHPDLGTESEFVDLVKLLHDIGLQVVVDFVPNHTNTEHKWLQNHPEYYQYRDGRLINEFSGDVYKLNYDSQELRYEMIQVLDTIFSWGVDGVRCDMAHLIPADFWQQAIDQTRSNYPKAAFVAEAYPVSEFDYSNIMGLTSAGFDAVYNQAFYALLYRLIGEQHPSWWLVEHLQALATNFKAMPVNYLANHDDPMLNNRRPGSNANLESMCEDYFEALLALTLFSPGLPLVYNGSLLGFNHRLAHHWCEFLPREYIETSEALSANVVKLFEWRARLAGSSIIPEPLAEHIAALKLDQTDRSWQLIVNVGRDDWLVPDRFSRLGLWHGLRGSDRLLGGQAELFEIFS
jgi:glycosidase